MTIYDLYGSMSEDMAKAKETLEDALEIDFIYKESGYYGGEYFFFGERGKENFIIKRNIDPIDGEPAEMKFPGSKILFYVNDTLRASDIHESVALKAKGFTLLIRKEM
jgi:hypothetical protein